MIHPSLNIKSSGYVKESVNIGQSVLRLIPVTPNSVTALLIYYQTKIRGEGPEVQQSISEENLNIN
jgi:hypothetical protein